jgi:hypothetical protein
MYRLIPKSKPRPKQTKCLLPRLRWPIFGNLSDIEVEIGMDEHGQPVRTQLFEHSIAAQPVSQPPASKLRMQSMDVLRITQSEEFEVDTVNKDFKYKDLLIETEDGSPITIGEFVAQTHEHLNEFKRIIIEFKCSLIHGTFDDERLARIGVSKDDFKVYFDHILSDFKDENDMSCCLVTFAEGEYEDLTLEDVLREKNEDN